MEISNKDQQKNGLWLTILATVIVTAVLILGALYLFDGLQLGGNELVDGAAVNAEVSGTEGMVHTEGMDHEAVMSARQNEVAELGAEVMPFDLDRTTHVFEKTDFGGIQEVISDDGDADQITLIQSHLNEELGRFQNGDFGDPAAIHGAEMPGLAALQANYEAIDVAYAPLAEGGRITYTTADPDLLIALHAWFDAQLADHGGHATDQK